MFEYLTGLPTAEWSDVQMATRGVLGRGEGNGVNFLDGEEVKRASLALRAVVPPPMQAWLRGRIGQLYGETLEGLAKRRQHFQECIGDFAKLRAFYEFAALGNQVAILQVE